MPINENTLEQVIISELQEKGYEYLYGPDIDRDYHEVILKDYFDSVMFKINPKITANIVEEAYKSITRRMHRGIWKAHPLSMALMAQSW